jgi:hypothetical protein
VCPNPSTKFRQTSKSWLVLTESADRLHIKRPARLFLNLRGELLAKATGEFFDAFLSICRVGRCITTSLKLSPSRFSSFRSRYASSWSEIVVVPMYTYLHVSPKSV